MSDELWFLITCMIFIITEFVHYLADVQEAKNAEVNERLRQQGNQ